MAQTKDYLYHKQHPERKSRKPRETPGTVPRKTTQETRAAKEALNTSVRTFGVVAVVMVIFLFGAMQVARKSWDNRVKKSRQTKATKAEGKALIPVEEKSADLIAKDSEDTIRRTVRTELNTDSIRKAVFLAKRGEALVASGEYKEAIERYREALNVWPYLTEGWAQLGRLYLDTKEYTKAQIALERAVENDPGSPEILNDLAVAHLFQNRVAKAKELFEAATEIDPTFAPSYFNIALCHMALEDRVSAEDMLDQYLRFSPADPRALKEKAFMQASDGKYKDALKTLRTALSEAPEWPPLYFDAAATAALLGRTEDSIKYLDKSEALTSPATVYQVFRQPAFKEIRLTELGKMFERELADRARSRVTPEALAEAQPADSVTEPLSSTTPSL